MLPGEGTHRGRNSGLKKIEIEDQDPVKEEVRCVESESQIVVMATVPM